MGLEPPIAQPITASAMGFLHLMLNAPWAVPCASTRPVGNAIGGPMGFVPHIAQPAGSDESYPIG